ncbi:MAG: hypothetical protein Q8K78_03735 [Planctomycetaceae bacterium]|nr:hypothetical protein [Planctomycetaceae bacterium]
MSRSHLPTVPVRCPGPTGLGVPGRRAFLKTGLAGFASLSLPAILRLQAQSRLHAAETSP